MAKQIKFTSGTLQAIVPNDANTLYMLRLFNKAGIQVYAATQSKRGAKVWKDKYKNICEL